MRISTKIYRLLTPPERKSAFSLLVLMFIGMALEMLGIGLVIPIVGLMTQSDIAATYPGLAPTLRALGNPSQTQLVIGVMVALVGIYLIKAVFLVFVAWRQTKFAYGVLVELSHRLFMTYLRQPYTFHLQRNSAELIRNAVNEVSQVNGLITAVSGLITEGLVVVGIAGLLMFVEPVGTLIVAVLLGGVAWGLHFSTRGPVARWGLARQHHEGMRVKHLQQGLGSAKDVKLLGREAEFLDQYQTHNVQSARVGRLQSVLQLLPRQVLEVLAVAGLAALVITMLVQDQSLSGIVPTLALFSVAAFRLIPSANRLLGAMQSVRFGLPVINVLYDELQLPAPPPARKREFISPLASEIRLSGVTYAYPAAPGPSLFDVSLTVRKGECVGFIGPSGAGKSTLVDVILGLLPPTTGTVTVDGAEIHGDPRAWQDQIGYVPQTIYLTDDTLRRNIAFGLPSALIDDAAVDRAVEAAQLEEFVAGKPEGLETIVGERGVRLSGGQRQRIGIARALYHDPGVLVLDEATSALNTATEAGVLDAIRALQGSKTIIIVAHRRSTVEICDRLYRLEHGRIVGDQSIERVAGAASAQAF